MKVATATSHFFHSFHNFFPELEVIDPKKRNVDEFNLIIFTGGEDINPRYYGQDNTHSSYNDMRDDIETSILRRCLDFQIKILGVCRGHQLINAYLGGDMVQDIYLDTNEYHESDHKLNFISSNSLIRYLYDGKTVNSMHHQGVVRPGKNLKATSNYKGIIESCESSNIFTVQFHPEFMGDENFFNAVKLWVEDRDALIEKLSKNKKTIKLEDSAYTYTTNSTNFLNPEQEEELRVTFERMRRAIPPPVNPDINFRVPEVGGNFTTRVVPNINFEPIQVNFDDDIDEVIDNDEEFLDNGDD